MLKCSASDRDDPTVDPRFGRVGKQTIEDTGALTKKRMETIDDETSAAAIDFIKRQAQANRPFFCWFNSTRMHAITHVRPSMQGQSGISEYFDGMIEHDGHVGQINSQSAGRPEHRQRHHRGLLDRQRPAHEYVARRRLHAVPQRKELELGRRLPRAGVRALAGSHSGGKRVERDFLGPRRVSDFARGGRRYRREGTLAHGMATAGRRAHLQAAPRRLQSTPVPDRATTKFGAQGILLLQRRRPARCDALRDHQAEQREAGTLQIWREPFTCLRAPKMYNLRMDPYERSDITSNTYNDWTFRLSFLVVPAQALVAQFIGTFKEFPPRQTPSSFSVDQIMETLKRPQGG